MTTTAIRRPRMTVPEFLAWSAHQPDEDRYELVDGEIVAMTRDTVRHNQTKASAWRALDAALRAAGLPCASFIDGVGVVVGEKTLRIPDVVVQCGTTPDPEDLVLEAPLIVVEVVSPSSERDDIETKLLDYFKIASVRHYLILFADKRAVVHHRRDDAGEIATRLLYDGELRLEPPGIVVPILSLFGPLSSGQEGNG